MSNTSGSLPTSSPAAAPAQTGTRHLQAALLAGLLVAALLLSKWVFFGSSLYEAQAVLMPSPERATDARSFIELATRKAQRARAEDDVALSALLRNRQLVFVCRASSPHVASQQCGELVGSALTARLVTRVLEAPTLPTEPLPLGTWLELLVAALLAGGVAGLATFGLGALLARHAAPLVVPASVRPVGPVPLSSIPPPSVYTMSMRPEGELALEARVLSQQGAWSVPPTGPVAVASASLRPAANSAGGAPSGDTLHTLRSVRDELYLRAASGSVVVGVTSAAAERGAKARTAAQLATMLAEAQQVRVLLLEADFQQPQVDVSTGTSMPPFAGFSKQIYNRVKEQRRDPWSVVRHGPWLSVLAEGAVRTPGMMYSAHFATAIGELREQYDIIVADGPVLSDAVELSVFDDVTDGVLYVAPARAQAHGAHDEASQRFRSKSFLIVLSA